MSSLQDAIDRALGYLSKTQSANGSWKGDYSGPMFLLPTLICTRYAIGFNWTREQTDAIETYLFANQNDDGGWGLHVGDESRQYTSVLNYVGLRLLGMDENDSQMVSARDFIQRGGGATALPQWGKFLLAVMNLYDYRGVMPVPAQMWLLPTALPMHPSRLWCHSRMVLLPMTYLYSRRAQIPENELIRSVRDEIFVDSFADVRWKSSIFQIAVADAYRPLHWSLSVFGKLLKAMEWTTPFLKQRALDDVLKHVDQEDQNTNYLCIGPINKLLNTLCWHFSHPDGLQFKRHVERLNDYLSQDDQGLRMNGYNSSELWDTGFAVQAICAADCDDRHRPMMRRASNFIAQQQVSEDVPQHKTYYRHRSRGGWPFSDADHGWPISDCTSLGLEASLNVAKHVESSVDRERATAAARLILSLQNSDGGWATYEKTRGPKWLEKLNATSLFSDVMIDYSYVECTSSSLQSLIRFREEYPDALSGELESSVRRGAAFIRNQQNTDGSWYGSWGICYTYGTWFGVWGLRASGADADDPAIERATQFLINQQLDDGGWGETMLSCREQKYCSTKSGQAVMTAWALLTLMKSRHANSDSCERAAQFLLSRQCDDGSWPPEEIAGVFNKTCAINYANYVNIFPLWALQLRRRKISEQSGTER